MNINSIGVKEKRVEIFHPATKKGLGFFFHIKPPQDDAIQAVVRKQRDLLIESKGNISEEQSEKNGIELITAAISGWEWEGDANWNGEKLEFNKENLLDVLKSKAGQHFIMKQLLREFRDADSFFTS